MNKRRILHFPTNTGGHPYGLSFKEKQQGHTSHCVTLKTPPFNFPSDYVLYSGNNLIIQEFIKWCFFIFSLFYYNEFHFNYGSKFFTFIGPDYRNQKSFIKKLFLIIYAGYCKIFGKLDLIILKALNKKISVTFQGDDIRQGDYCRANYPIHFASEVPADYYTAFTDDRKRKLVTMFDNYADEIFALNPDLLNILPSRAKFFPYQHLVNKPKTFSTQNKTTPKFTIIHAPSNRSVKGTAYILEALKELKSEDPSIELILIEKLSYEEALKVYEQADLAIDQIFAGWYGAFAVDVMQFGTPVMAYIREEDLSKLPEKFRQDLPVLYTKVNTLKGDIKNAIQLVRENRLNRAEIFNFVQKWH